MSVRKMLLVEDDEPSRKDWVELLERRDWDVVVASNGKEALEKLCAPQAHFDVIVLDHFMPEMKGDEFLECIQDHGLTVPPVIVVSAHIRDERSVDAADASRASREKYLYLGADFILTKPYNAAELDKMARAIAERPEQLTPKIEFNDELLDYMVKRREAALREVLAKSASNTNRNWSDGELVFVIGRRWNSWYPSIFPALGGAYAIVGPPESVHHPHQSSPRIPVAVVDPGFQFMRVLAQLGIPWRDLDCCVITHNHPDHMAGIFELMTARYALGKQTKLLCSPACRVMLGDCAGFNLEIKELDGAASELIKAYSAGGKWLRLRAKAFDTAHEEIGRENSSKGLRIIYESGDAPNALEEIAEVVILGDTEYDRSQHRERFVGALCKPNVKVAILHLGSCQLKQGTGKHLYLPGLKQILNDMESELSAIQYRGRLLVLISEWGLEHATREQMEKIYSVPLPGFNNYSPIIETVRFLQKSLQLKKILLMPADIGLAVGMESGKIYLGPESATAPEQVDFSVTEDGIRYTRKQVNSAAAS